VFVSLDAAHMLKLARNAWATFRLLLSDLGEIDYKYIEMLIRLQVDIGLKFGNKVLALSMSECKLDKERCYQFIINICNPV